MPCACARTLTNFTCIMMSNFDGTAALVSPRETIVESLILKGFLAVNKS
jgi:hypothetical protein